MTRSNDPSDSITPLRLWPGVTIVIIQWLARFALPKMAPDAMEVSVLTGLACYPLMLIWWAFFSKAPKAERWGGIVVIIGGMLLVSQITHVSVSTGMMGMMYFIYAIPTLTLGFVVWALLSRGVFQNARWTTMVAAVLVSCGGWTLVRTTGFSGDGNSEFFWRWSQTAEEQLLVMEENPATAEVMAEIDENPVWPGFRGPNRDSIIGNAGIETNWSASPPVELWRRPVGPGWSSFAVSGKVFYTQEQRGEEEMVSCYDLETGEPVWKHGDQARFWESNAGAGPRGTPTLGHGKVYTLGGTGIVNAVDARNGSLIWSQNAAEDTGAKLPVWAFSGSPLLLDDLVIVTASGALIAYDAATGEQRWKGPAGGEGYCSPQRFTIDGVDQVLHLSGEGLSSVAPGDGALLWEHPWEGFPIVQPAQGPDGSVFVSVDAKSGLRNLDITQNDGAWAVAERWTSKRLKPYFNDFVLHKGHAYGFDGAILACMEIEKGERKWKGGRYGNGQLILLADQDLLLVLSEQGELILVNATPEQFTEVARVHGIEGRTWNHPVLAGDTLLVRNDQEMAAFRLRLTTN